MDGWGAGARRAKKRGRRRRALFYSMDALMGGWVDVLVFCFGGVCVGGGLSVVVLMDGWVDGWMGGGGGVLMGFGQHEGGAL